MTRDGTVNHGTYAGYQKHRRDGSEPCDDCRRANRDYGRQLRARDPQNRAKDRMWNTSRSRALQRLAKEYPERFAELVAEERPCCLEHAP